MGAEPRDVCRGRGGVDLVPIRVDVVQSCGGKADVSNLIARGGVRNGVECRTTYGCAEAFVRVLGLRAKEDVLGLAAHRGRDGVKAERGHVLVLACRRKSPRSRGWVGDFALPDKVRSVRLQGKHTRE